VVPLEPRHLLNTDGSCFVDLEEVAALLELLSNPERIAYRDGNASTIGRCAQQRLLVVAGPGAGKSHLFISRIEHWLGESGDAIYVATFVRKLVADLTSDIDRTLPDPYRRRVDVSTLHALARSLVSRNGGTARRRLGKYVRIIDEFWAGVVWRDVCAFHAEIPGAEYTTEALQDQLHKEAPDASDEWVALRSTYNQLCGFYNAVGFAFLIVLARVAVEENPALVQHQRWILDEYQDFNPAEDHLIRCLTEKANGLVLAGDDDQAIYQTLKASDPEIVCGHYNDASFAKAMLPFCSRCGYFICRAADAFMSKHRTEGGITKIFMPVNVDEGARRVQVVAAATPATGVDYVRKFLEDTADEYQEYLQRRREGIDTDPFLLVLSHNGHLTRNKTSTEDVELEVLLGTYAGDTSPRSDDYRRVRSYAAAGRSAEDNFAFRKLLHVEGVGTDEVHDLLDDALRSGRTLAEVAADSHRELIECAQKVAELLEECTDSQEDAVPGLADLLGLADGAALAQELADWPIGAAPMTEEDEEAIAMAGAIGPVSLMTISGSKGLSAHHVIIVGCDDVNMVRSTPLGFFVALTRARRSLHLVVSFKAGGAREPHPFVLDLPEDCCDYVSYAKGTRVITQLGSRQAFEEKFKSWRNVIRYAVDKRRAH